MKDHALCVCQYQISQPQVTSSSVDVKVNIYILHHRSKYDITFTIPKEGMLPPQF